MEKTQAMHLDACLPQSWWEFAVLHAVHLYNRTLVRRIDWKTPYEKLKHKVPDVSHLRVFGCGAYVFILKEVCINKLAPRSELMTFIGLAEGVKGYLFMRKPNNVVFTAAKALCDETMYPNCPDTNHQGFTPVGNDPNTDDHIPPEDDESDDLDGDDDSGLTERRLSNPSYPNDLDQESDQGSKKGDLQEPPVTPPNHGTTLLPPATPCKQGRTAQPPVHRPLTRETTSTRQQEEQSDLQPRRSA